MLMKLQKLKSALAVCAVLAGGAFVTATPAYADAIGTMPSGCSISPSTPTVYSSTRQISFGGSGSCSRATSMDFRLVHNYSGLPDVRVRNVNIPGSPTTYHGLTCNNGGTKQYYSEIALLGTGSTVQRVSRTVTLSHC